MYRLLLIFNCNLHRMSPTATLHKCILHCSQKHNGESFVWLPGNAPFFVHSSVVRAQRAEASHVSISDLQQHMIHNPVENFTRKHSKCMDAPSAGCASRLGMDTMQCITHGILAMYLLTQRVAISPDMFVSGVCVVCLLDLQAQHAWLALIRPGICAAIV